MPVSRLTAELTRAVHRSPLSLGDKLRADAVVARDWAMPRWRDIGGEVKRLVRSPGT